MFNNSNLIFSILLVLFAYILGSISSAILLCRLLKFPDPRSYGSKNPGTTNVLRSAGKKLAAFVLLFDVLKGVIAVLIPKYFGFSNLLVSAAAIAVFLGHLFPIFFNFTGGKGVATTLGIMLVLCWQLGLLCLLIWVMMFKITRLSSLAALVATLSAMFVATISLFLKLNYWIQQEFAICIILLGLGIVLKHKSNIHNLFNKTEDKV